MTDTNTPDSPAIPSKPAIFGADMMIPPVGFLVIFAPFVVGFENGRAKSIQ
jgi:hypothetical protein